MSSQGSQKLGISAIFLSGCLWGTIGIFIHRLLESGLSSLDIAFLRSFCACLLFGLYLLVFRRAAFRIKLRDIWCFLGTGILSIAFFNFCYFATIEATSMAVAAILLYTSPVFVLLLSLPLFGEKITPRKVIAILLVVVGCALVSGVVGGKVQLGFGSLLLGIGAGLGYALYSIFGRFAISRGYRTETINFYSFLFAAIALFPLTDLGALRTVTTDAKTATFALLLSLVATLLPYFCYTYGLARVENGIAAIVAGIEPVVATVMGVLVMHEPAPDLPTILGILLVLCAIVLPNLPRGKKEIL